MRRIGIMGGTFDPIHYGHLLAAEAARVHFGLEEVTFVPTGTPPHKKREVADASHRFEMTLRAIASNPCFKISSLEIERPGYSYSIDTVSAFKESLGPGLELFFISGADAILDIMSWKQVDRLLDMCNFIAVTRPGFDLKDLERLDILQQEHQGKLFLLPIPGMAISSTFIRQRVAEGNTIKYLLPEAVEAYIYDAGLYRKLPFTE